MSRFRVEDQITMLEGMIETGWEFYSKPYTDEAVLKEFAKVKIDDEEFQITNHMMLEIVKFIAVVREDQRENDQQINTLKLDVRELRRKLEKAEDYASMSDPRIAGELDKEITYFETHEGEENLVYGPVKLMKYCRDRLRSRR